MNFASELVTLGTGAAPAYLLLRLCERTTKKATSAICTRSGQWLIAQRVLRSSLAAVHQCLAGCRSF